MTTAAPRRLLDRIRAIVRTTVVVGLLGYAMLMTLDVLLYHLGSRLPFFTPPQKELLYSHGVFAAFRHPDYRPWLKGFVNEPGHPETTVSVDDASRAYGLPLDNVPTAQLSAVDALGWWNDKTPAQAQTLFLGDSFCYGAGSGTENSIYRLFEKTTGIPDYAACKGGYGLPHYALLLETLTSDALGPENRFAGKTVYVLLYVGNDLTADVLVFRQRRMDEVVGPARHLWLESIRNLLAYLEESRALTRQEAGPAPPDQALDHTMGYYPVPVGAPGAATVFAFHPFYRTLVDLSWFGPAEESELKAVFAQMAHVATQRHLDVRVVVIPTGLQVLYPHIDKTRLDPASPFAKEAPRAVKNLNQLTAFAVSAAEEAGLPVLDLEPLLVGRDDVADLYRPTDTHMTPRGNEVIVESIQKAFPTP